MQLLTKCLRRRPNVIIAGDFLAGYITWDTNEVAGNSNYVDAKN